MASGDLRVLPETSPSWCWLPRRLSPQTLPLFTSLLLSVRELASLLCRLGPAGRLSASSPPCYSPAASALLSTLCALEPSQPGGGLSHESRRPSRATARAARAEPPAACGPWPGWVSPAGQLLPRPPGRVAGVWTSVLGVESGTESARHRASYPGGGRGAPSALPPLWG